MIILAYIAIGIVWLLIGTIVYYCKVAKIQKEFGVYNMGNTDEVPEIFIIGFFAIFGLIAFTFPTSLLTH